MQFREPEFQDSEIRVTRLQSRRNMLDMSYELLETRLRWDVLATSIDVMRGGRERMADLVSDYGNQLS
jgi:hypothetical protein